jgi:hypothetical protein
MPSLAEFDRQTLLNIRHRIYELEYLASGL